MKILVVGGAGYIGSHVAREFLDAGHQVVVFDDLSSGLKTNLFPDGEFVQGSICNTKEITDVMKSGFDGVVHLAAFKDVALSMTEPGIFAVNNISGTITLLNAMIECEVKNIVFSSSASVFGEPQYLPLDEAHPTNPESFYGFTKLEIERILMWYDQLKGLKSASLRYFNASGYDVEGRIRGIEKQTTNLIPVIMEVAVGAREGLKVYGDDYETRDGSCIRDFIHVNDLASAHLLSMEYLVAEKTSQIFNLGNERGTSVLEILELARKITGLEIPAERVGRRAGDPSNLVASSKKIRELIGFNPKYEDVHAMVESTWKVYQYNYAEKNTECG